jgi:hypothetical protein
VHEFAIKFSKLIGQKIYEVHAVCMVILWGGRLLLSPLYLSVDPGFIIRTKQKDNALKLL